MSNETEKSECPCFSSNCSRHGDCEKCQEHHKSNGSRTSCGK